MVLEQSDFEECNFKIKLSRYVFTILRKCTPIDVYVVNVCVKWEAAGRKQSQA